MRIEMPMTIAQQVEALESAAHALESAGGNFIATVMIDQNREKLIEEGGPAIREAYEILDNDRERWRAARVQLHRALGTQRP